LLAIIFLKETLTIQKITGAILALAGVGVISLWGTQNASFEVKYLLAALTILLAAITGSVYTIAGKKLLTRYSPLSLTVYAMLLGSLVLIPTAVMTPTLIAEITTMSTKTWLAVLFLGVFSTVIGYVLWYVGLEKKTASQVSVYLYAVPILSTIISYFMFPGNGITLFFLLGGLFIICGLVLVNKKEIA
jgi:drug/metabolite transporter (DMT)-like permease